MFRFFSILLLGLILPSALFSRDIDIPVEPAVPVAAEVAVPALAPPDTSNRAPGQQLFLRRATVRFSDKRTWKGVIQLSNSVLISLTNRSFDHMSIDTLTVYNLRKLKIVRWRADPQSNGLFLFTPSEYRIFTDPSDPAGMKYSFPISHFDRFVFTGQDRSSVLYSVFYDRWVQGKTGAFRWENTKATTFGFNLENPVPGVVTEIEFEERY